MEKYLYDLSDEVITMFNANKLKIVGTNFKFVGKGETSNYNQRPATYLFDGIKSIQPINDGYVLNGNAFLEPTRDGIDYRWYNSSNPSEATIMLELVIGDPTVDIIMMNPGWRITPLADGQTVLLENITLINNMLWSEAPRNYEFKSYGLLYAVSGIVDGDYGPVKLIADYYNGSKSEDWNRGSGREDFIKVSINRDCALDKDVTNDDRYDPLIADYIFKQEDIDDLDIEGITMMTYTGEKQNSTGALRVTIDELFPNI